MPLLCRIYKLNSDTGRLRITSNDLDDWNCTVARFEKEHKGRWYHPSRDTRQSLDLPWYHIFFCGWHLSDIKSRKTLIYFKIYVFCLTFVWRGNGHFCAIFVKHLYNKIGISQKRSRNWAILRLTDVKQWCKIWYRKFRWHCQLSSIKWYQNSLCSFQILDL